MVSYCHFVLYVCLSICPFGYKENPNKQLVNKLNHSYMKSRQRIHPATNRKDAIVCSYSCSFDKKIEAFFEVI